MPRNRKIFTGRSIGEWSGGEHTSRKPNIGLEKLVAARINKGMITTIDSADIPIEALQLAKNAKVVFDRTSRRDGLEAFGPTKPNSNTILKMASIKQPSGAGHTYRFTPDSIHDLQSGVWNAITQLTPLAGTESDRLNIATVFDIFAFTNNGANNVQWINSDTDESDDLIESSGYEYGNFAFRYCTGFFGRVVLAALREENEILLAWTGEFGSKNTAKHGLEDLDPLVNETSGFAPLIDSPKDRSDFITGIFGMSSVLTILREKSIWIATKQPSATNPFNAYAAVPGIGCDSPFSAQVTNYGLAWLDRRTRTVYHYTPGASPEPIGKPIEKNIINNITDPELVFGMYDPREDSYSVCIPSVGTNVVQVWTYYFKTQAWTYNEYLDLSSFDEVELLTGAVAIDDLVGSIDELVGDIDDLSPVVPSQTERVFGFNTGDLAIPSVTAISDVVNLFHTDLVSKTFMLPGLDTYIAMVVIELLVELPTTVELWYAPDGGVDPGSSFIFGDSFHIDVLNKPQIITFRKVVHSRRYAFSLRSTSETIISPGKFTVLGYELWITPSGDISMTRQVT